MSSFYKSNLMDKYDSLLIPSENDLKKEEEESITSDDVDLEGNEDANSPVLLTNAVIDYPYGKQLYGYSIFLSIIFLAFIFYVISFTFERPGRLEHGEIIPKKFLDPCNASGLISFDEIEKIKEEMQAISDKKNCINSVAKYNISTYTTEYLTQKLANLTEASNALNQELEYQKELRFPCYKANLEKRCENQNIQGIYQQIPTFFHAYAICILILLSVPYFFAIKVRKMELTADQKVAFNRALSFSNMIFWQHILFVILMIGISYLDTCDVEKDLQRFSL